MKTITFFFFFAFTSSCFAQQVVTGKVYSIVNGSSLSTTTLRIDKKQLIQTDTNGVFTITTSKRKIRISIVPENIYRFDTSLFVNSLTDTLKLFIAHPIDSLLATYDIDHNLVQLFCGGGIAPLAPMPSDKIFESKYAVKYHMLDCLMPSITDLISYNQRVALYLDTKYGVDWRQTVRPDIFGVSKKAYR